MNLTYKQSELVSIIHVFENKFSGAENYSSLF